MSKHQNFVAETIKRQQIKNAAYNPRTIDKNARRKLKQSISEAGLVETLVWNRRTGNLVGGHQRISVLDELEGTQDYDLTVAVVDVPIEREKALNVSLNNTTMQGAFDSELLSELCKEVAITELFVLGFDATELKAIKGEDIFGGLGNTAERNDKELIDQINGARQRKKERESKDNDADHYLVVVFESQSAKDGFLERTGIVADDGFIDGRYFETMTVGS